MAGDKNLPAPLTGFGQGNTERRRAATEAFGEGMASLDLDALDGAALDEAPEEKPKAKSDPKEMLADIPDGPLRDDVELIIAQSVRCRPRAPSRRRGRRRPRSGSRGRPGSRGPRR